MKAPEPDDARAAAETLDVEDLYRRYAPTAHRRARRILGNDEDAREVVHDLFSSLLQNPAQFAGRSRLTTFMYSAVTHACLNRLRNQRNRARLLEANPFAEGQPGQRASPEIVAALRSVLARMPEELATVTVYHHGEGLTHDDIARLLGCSPRHVGNLLARARRVVLHEVEADGDKHHG